MAKKYGYKRKLIKEFKIFVDGRCFEISKSEQRRDEIIPILKNMYSQSEITFEPFNHYEYVKE